MALPADRPASVWVSVARSVRAADATVRADRTLRRVAIVVGLIFVVASMPKFFAFHWERDAFVRFELPVPGAMVILAGVLELVGGVLLVLRRQVVPSCLVLSAVMLVATVSGGIVGADPIPSLTLAPALLVVMVVLLGVAVRRPALRT